MFKKTLSGETEEEPTKKVYEINISCAGSSVKDFTFADLDKAKQLYNTIRDVILSRSRLVIIDSQNESEFIVPTQICSLELRPYNFPSSIADIEIEKTHVESIKILGN